MPIVVYYTVCSRSLAGSPRYRCCVDQAPFVIASRGCRHGEMLKGAKLGCMNLPVRSGGYAIVRNAAGEVAAVSTSRGLFLPGGGQEGTETPEHAAVREAYEECGLRIRVGSVSAADARGFFEHAGYRSTGHLL
jgi:8-oxo-dGTP pyrophosphatase MutT (NUDIX family)